MKKSFITGLVILLPSAISLWIISLTVHFLTRPFAGLAAKFLSRFNIQNLSFGFFSHEEVLYHGCQVMILLALLFITLFLGFLAQTFFLNSMLNLGSFLLQKIPLINKFYKTSKEIIKGLLLTEKNAFRQVVLVPFPYAETYAFGLIAGNAPKNHTDLQDDLVSVLVPTTPNPTTGFLLLFKKSELIPVDLKTEEVIKYIVSCGVMLPKGKPQ
ncbi:MAG: DUF502 domain-containing protein [Parachlamydiales bacterium]